ncbi:MAG TPA: VOC family protein [Tenuifilaceae bacterium]|nr:VOC family protein [Tenuifilaceae bacterium]
MEKIICGIQQIGIGVANNYKAWNWYIKAFGVDVRVFEDDTVAELMLPYTGGQPQKRHASLAINMQGGGGFEIWQYSGRTPLAPSFDVTLGDLGIFAAKIKCFDATKAYHHLKSQGIEPLGDVHSGPDGKLHFFVKDPFGNHFQVIESNSWFNNLDKPTGGTYGAVIGVSDIDKSLVVYQKILGYDKIVFDGVDSFNDLKDLPGGTRQMRRVVLTHSSPRKGALSELIGDSQIELVQLVGDKANKIFENRFWGDLGFIHLCFDVKHMSALEKECNEAGFPFTVNSNVKHNTNGSFDMGEAAGHFTYIEDPDGTLIEFVETHKIPIMKNLGLFISLDKRDPEKRLPRWMLKLLGLKKVKGL